jgi:hypothetical protein
VHHAPVVEPPEPALRHRRPGTLLVLDASLPGGLIEGSGWARSREDFGRR